MSTSQFTRATGWGVLAIAIILSLLILTEWVVIRWLGEGDLTRAAAYGDAFGLANALFAGLAFLGVIWAIRLQSEELALQRQELKESREELKRSADAQEQVREAMVLSAYFNVSSTVLSGVADVSRGDPTFFKLTAGLHQRLLMRMYESLTSIENMKSKPIEQLRSDTPVETWIRGLASGIQESLGVAKTSNDTFLADAILRQVRHHLTIILSSMDDVESDVAGEVSLLIKLIDELPKPPLVSGAEVPDNPEFIQSFWRHIEEFNLQLADTASHGY